MLKTCMTCKFYQANTETSGLCRRYPPTVFPSVNGTIQDEVIYTNLDMVFPEVHQTCWCGEYERLTIDEEIISND